jgi:hypothetical protein
MSLVVWSKSSTICDDYSRFGRIDSAGKSHILLIIIIKGDEGALWMMKRFVKRV